MDVAGAAVRLTAAWAVGQGVAHGHQRSQGGHRWVFGTQVPVEVGQDRLGCYESFAVHVTPRR